MPEVRPFAAFRFNPDRLGRDQSAVLAPPYDVLEQSDKEALLARSPHNIVAVDLPHVPPKSAGPEPVYRRAADTLQGWLADGVLIREASPAIYVYHQRFEHEGQAFTRRMFLACLRLVPFSEGSILPHEQTFGGPKEDRLALMKATGCQLSPIFGLYTDPGDEIGPGFAAVVKREPDVVGTLNDVENRMWVVSDEKVISRVASVFREKKVYIADGHHRYGTALLYREWLAGTAGQLPADHPANYVMFALCAMDDPGCLILPDYRVIESIHLDALLDAWREGVATADAESIGGTSNGDAPDLVVHEGVTGFEVALRYSQRDVLAELEPKENAAWRALDYAYMHRYLIDELLTGYLQRGGQSPKLHYLKSAEEAIRTACQTDGVALLTRATPMAHLRAVSEAGGLMPQKSTYFHPKLATGITIHRLT